MVAASRAGWNYRTTGTPIMSCPTPRLIERTSFRCRRFALRATGPKERRMQEISLEKARPGQRKAIQISLERMELGELFTSLILPTRYGKSDVIRTVAAIGYLDQIIATTLALFPNEFLREQLIHQEKVAAWGSRYSVPTNNLLCDRLKTLPKRALRPNREFLLCSTIQLFSKNADIFGELIEDLYHKTEKPTLIFVDEGHTGSEDNTWGGSYRQVIEKYAALGIVTTATAIRADGCLIPGFEKKVLGSEKATVYKTRPHATNGNLITVEKWQCTKEEVELQAHHETTFQEAWEEDPSPLCQLDWFPFDVCLQDIAGVETEARMLSELSATEARKWLRTIVRDPVAIRQGASLACEVLRNFRMVDPGIVMIVFCGNDEKTEEANKHAKQIEGIFKEINPRLKAVIATSADGDGKELIENFSRGMGDILIVKQMASLGLDVEPLKVGLDLSTMRTAVGLIQRYNRLTTRYKHFEIGVMVSPFDVLSKDIFERFIHQQGGGKVITDLERIEVYDKKKETKPGQPVYIVDGAMGSEFFDTQGNEAARTFHEQARALFLAFPELHQRLSHAAAMQRLSASGIQFQPNAPTGATDLGWEIDAIRSDINRLAGDIAMSRIGGHYNQPAYQQQIKAVHNAAKIKAGVNPEDVSISHERDLGVLKSIKSAMLLIWSHAGLNTEAATDEVR